MTIRLNWPSQAEKNLTSIEIYRKVGWNATLDVNNPGTPYATLAGTATEFIDAVENLTNNTIYKYWIGAVKGTERLIGAPVMQGFFLDTGPGPQTIKRGDWAAGYFGTVAKADFFDTPELKLILPAAQGAMFVYDPVAWHKFVFRGKIFYIPTSSHNRGTTFNTIYARGMAYGTDDTGRVIPSGQNAAVQDCKVSKAGRTYRIRLPRTIDDADSTSSQTHQNGEWMNTMARLYGGSLAFSNAGQGAFDTLATLSSGTSSNEEGAAMLTPLYTNATGYFAYPYNPMIVTTYNGLTTAVTVYFVFELVLP
ncbi:putative virion structural protein [Erwinia phage vB_EamM_Phobos]|uniref:putative virion structural protein n=1 Tax=Erwinia phage vB_EamM_Phobos TaxID=1883377 RepID=UPI00081C4109|nr:putative virion structural protein [Erwinia phage vB_EamM_Phobos]ANZ50338.1 putative virion structural protein [Erwinia phage vB_EamM_Phobos]